MPIWQCAHVIAHRTASVAKVDNRWVMGMSVGTCVSNFSRRDPNLAWKTSCILRVFCVLEDLFKWLRKKVVPKTTVLAS